MYFIAAVAEDGIAWIHLAFPKSIPGLEGGDRSEPKPEAAPGTHTVPVCILCAGYA